MIRLSQPMMLRDGPFPARAAELVHAPEPARQGSVGLS